MAKKLNMFNALIEPPTGKFSTFTPHEFLIYSALFIL